MIVEAFHHEDYPAGRLVPALARRAAELRDQGFDNVSVHATDSPARIVAYSRSRVVRVRPGPPSNGQIRPADRRATPTGTSPPTPS